MCGLGRLRQGFPTRQYPHRYGAGAAGLVAIQPLVPGGTYRFITGRDPGPLRLDADLPERPRDPFATQILLSPQPSPMTLRSLRTVLDGIPALAIERSFVAADGGQIPWSDATDALERSFRMLVTRQATLA